MGDQSSFRFQDLSLRLGLEGKGPGNEVLEVNLMNFRRKGTVFEKYFPWNNSGFNVTWAHDNRRIDRYNTTNSFRFALSQVQNRKMISCMQGNLFLHFFIVSARLSSSNQPAKSKLVNIESTLRNESSLKI